jgi:hypothetical protein
MVTKVETGIGRTSRKYLILIRTFSWPIDRSFLIDHGCIGVKSNRAEASWICEVMGRPVSRKKSRGNTIPAMVNGPYEWDHGFHCCVIGDHDSWFIGSS